MHAVVRNYSGPGAKELFDLLDEHKSEVESLLRTVPGLVSYTMLHTDGGGATVTVCQDKAGTDESVRVAREWIQENASGVGASPPSISEGSVIVSLK
ncbi:MAG: hypothetical protein GTO67_13445 [Gammaproteobacteria bacterium]|nr:hypothetical protein [Gammaproteobacteria bacterium]NIN39573.1 hypothetical protein [Gammaproteobacteria bacterium]NIO25130.1 hypothetical protein [Gammaproteobacteria bacterium]NIO65759.1 hypothetical protein [Gammaproteobacteria bacterium]NIP45804.1 hypothetical protein [Gammaproteobacteria bacterium]